MPRRRVTNHLANPVMRPVLHARDGTRIWILPASPEDKSWWRNLRGGAEVDLAPGSGRPGVSPQQVHGRSP